MSQRVVYYNGRYVPEALARVSIYDVGFLMGDMAYEVTRTVHGKPLRLEEHLARLAHSLVGLRIDPGLSRDELRAATLETLARNLSSEPPEVDWTIVHNVSRGPASGFLDAFSAEEQRPTVIISCYPLVERLAALADAYDSGVDLVVPRQQSLPGELWDDTLKTRSRLHYQLANLQAAEIQPGAWAAMVDPRGYLTEGTSGNLFVVRSGELLTPRAGNLLPGVTRQWVLELAAAKGIACHEVDLTPEDAAAADEMFLTATSTGILHARSFQGRTIGDGRLQPVTAQLRTALNAAVGIDFAAQARRCAVILAERRRMTP